MAKQAAKRRRARRTSFTTQFALVLLGVGLVTALVAGAVVWFQARQTDSRQQLQSGVGAAALAATAVRLETASASQQFACELSRLPATGSAMAAGTREAMAELEAYTATSSPGQGLALLGPTGQVLAEGPPGSVAEISGVLGRIGAGSSSCAQRTGFFAGSTTGRVLGVGVAPVTSGGLDRGRVVVLTPVGTAVLAYARRLVDISGSRAYPMLVASGRLLEPASVAGTRYRAGARVPPAISSAVLGGRSAALVSLGGVQFAAARQSLRSSSGALVASLVVIDSGTRLGPTVADLAMPLALAVAGVILLGMVVVFLLVDRLLNRPLRRLDAAVRRLPREAEATPIPIEGAEEIARLGESLESMRQRLRRQTLGVVGRTVIAGTLSGNVPLEQALSQVLTSLARVVGAESGLLLVRPQERFPQGLLLTGGITGPIPSWPELEGGEGVLGTLVRSPRFLLRDHLDPAENGPAEKRIGLRNCLAQRLQDGGSSLGVLILCNRALPYGEEEATLCEDVANQIVVALQRSSQLEASQREATTDAMTGLYNYRFLVSYLDQQVNVAERAGAPLSVLMLDLDHFKQINDSHGHPAGDRVLRRFASLMVDTIRKSDLAARYGGEEFVVVMANTGRDDAELVAAKIRAAVEEMSVSLDDGTAVGVTVSVGGVTFPDGSRGARNLLDLADRALYAAKRQGRNCVEFLDLTAAPGEPVGS